MGGKALPILYVLYVWRCRSDNLLDVLHSLSEVHAVLKHLAQYRFQRSILHS
jgi:hypothetical protein